MDMVVPPSPTCLCFFILMKIWILQGTAVNIIVGTHVWVEDPTVAWIDGQVSKINGKEVAIETTNGKKVSCAHLKLNSNSLTKSSA